MEETLIRPLPGFDDPIEMLEACHGRMKNQLETLRRLAGWLPEHGPDAAARQAAAAILRYFRSAAVHHHQDEERDVFPRLLARIDTVDRHRVECLISSLLADHKALFAAWDALAGPLDAIAQGTGAELDADDVAYFTQQYRNHLECEEAMLFPLLLRHMEPQDLAEVGEKMRTRRQER
ncbi:MAG: hemerythrin domain-containing protein [Zoogloeaceae bacterium]|nr:hemerythrin domain-containing protein [Zoogloeaceae bacterium]